jgi:NADH:ubiquinone oxidoreductase subunit F (NADH-binding)
MLRLPHLVVERVILAGLVTGACAGFIFIRHEYQKQIEAVRNEIERATKLRACGENVFGSGRPFPVEVFESPGGYICGEQSALLEVMEDRRAQPRNRPPELGTNGLRDKPTLVNNVETLAWAPSIFLHGGAAYARAGWRAPGTNGRIGFAGQRLSSPSAET